MYDLQIILNIHHLILYLISMVGAGWLIDWLINWLFLIGWGAYMSILGLNRRSLCFEVNVFLFLFVIGFF